MERYALALEPIGLIETAPDRIVPKDLDFERAFFRKCPVNQRSSETATVIVRIDKQASDDILNHRNKADNPAVRFTHPGFRQCQIVVAQIMVFLFKKSLGQERVGKFTGRTPGGNHAFGIFRFEFPDHGQRCLSWFGMGNTGAFVR